MWKIKAIERYGALLIFLSAILCLFFGMLARDNIGKWVSTSGLLLTAAGVLQIEASGAFHNIMTFYENRKYGPPSYITREIIDNPDAPVWMWFRNIVSFEPRTGLWLIIGGTLMQVAANWI